MPLPETISSAYVHVEMGEAGQPVLVYPALYNQEQVADLISRAMQAKESDPATFDLAKWVSSNVGQYKAVDASETMNWIPVKIEPVPYYGRWLVTVSFTNAEGYWETIVDLISGTPDGANCLDSPHAYPYRSGITHWMKLPAPANHRPDEP